MPQALIGGFLVVHGLITVSIGFRSLTNPSGPATTLPSWFAWWPGPFGRSWLFEALHLGKAFSVVGGLVWLSAGLALIGGGIGLLGVTPLESVRDPLLVAGAALGLVWRQTPAA